MSMEAIWLRRINMKKHEWLGVLVFLLFAGISVRLGLFAGDILYKSEIRPSIAIDSENAKWILGYSLPIISKTYDNNDENTLGDMNYLMKVLFNINPDNPLSFLGSSSSLMAFYEDSGFFQQKNWNDSSEFIIKNPTKKDGSTGTKAFKGKTAESSIYYEGETLKTKENLTSNGKQVIYLPNETGYAVNVNKLLNEKVDFIKKRSGPKVLIYHTHALERYNSGIANVSKLSVNDSKMSVREVGEALTQNLNSLNINTLHNCTLHDLYDHNRAYVESLKTLTHYINSYPSISMTIDIHRDGSGVVGERLRAVKNINGRNAAKIMIVIGTNAGTLKHPNWIENMKLALKLQNILNKIAPGLTKPIYLSSNRYNEHVTKGSLLIEIGGDGNSISEAKESTKYLARAIKTLFDS